jgi:hypothetical protein
MSESTWRRNPAVRYVAMLLVVLLAWREGALLAEEVVAQAQSGLTIIVLEGAGARNDLAAGAARRLAVNVQDTATGPVAGVEVTFTAPMSGAGGTFPNGARRMTVMTNAQGIAIIDNFRPNTVTGNFQITVEASYRGQKAMTSISQSNFGIAKKSSSGKWILILGLAGGAAAAAVLAGKGGSEPSPTPTPTPTPTIRITPGTPSAGPPS